MSGSGPKPAVWIGSSLDELRSFPDDVQEFVGYALRIAQQGERHPDAKPLKGFRGAGVLEIVEDHRGDTYRAVYTVRLAGRIYVLHVKTPKHELDLIKARPHDAEQLHRELGGAK